ncbi:ribosomal silencing factor RsfS-like protein, 312 isoform X2 [Brevipalpus obovatus]|uniref:ribosomal silencing factor RsfS-like protein, 312 isoform X2 n=1 Tax=Brevipalpus obovatus TaxID=246614 RepID=UPI003D9ECFBE
MFFSTHVQNFISSFRVKNVMHSSRCHLPSVNSNYSVDKNRLLDDTETDNTDESKLVPSQRVRGDVFRAQEEQIILDFEEETYNVNVDDPDLPYKSRLPVDRLDQVNIERGQMGIFDMPDLVQTLRAENMRDIVVIKVPPELKYCDYMVIATAKSPRHLAGVTEFIIKLSKLKRSQDDRFLFVEGKDSKDWRVIDMDHIVLHLFMEETRRRYDLESLWTIGSEYDDHVQRASKPTIYDVAEKHLEYLKSLEVNEDTEAVDKLEKNISTVN